MNKRVALDEVIDVIREKLDAGGKVTFTPNGTSMLPMLRDGEDVVILEKPNRRLSLFDVALYRRSNGVYVLHRVVNFDSDGNYVMCGDNQFVKEYGITDEQIIAVMAAFYREGKPYRKDSLSYRAYINFLFYTKIFRRLYNSGKIRVKRILNRKGDSADEKKSD